MKFSHALFFFSVMFSPLAFSKTYTLISPSPSMGKIVNGAWQSDGCAAMLQQAS